MQIHMFDAAKKIMADMQRLGFEAYIVGGAVRDFLLGIPVHDIDLCTDARPEQVMAVFPRVKPTGVNYGTVTVITDDGLLFEVTTYRTEGKYSDGRRPDSVQFTPSLKEDLSRRDFTVNAMAMDQGENIIDPFGGRTDLVNGQLRAVGDPKVRFEEDGLRILRGNRLMCQLNFRIEEKTEEAMRMSRHRLQNLAIERVANEIKKMMETTFASLGWNTLNKLNLLTGIPVIASYLPSKWKASDLEVAIDFGDIEDSTVKWALLLFMWGLSSGTASLFLKEMTFSRKESEPIVTLLALNEKLGGLPESKNDKIRLLLDQGFDRVNQLIELATIVTNKHGQTISEQKRDVEQVYKEMPILSLKDLQVTGNELLDYINKAPGRWVSELLQKLMYAVAEQRCPNDIDSLLKYANTILGDNDEGTNS